MLGLALHLALMWPIFLQYAHIGLPSLVNSYFFLYAKVFSCGVFCVWTAETIILRAVSTFEVKSLMRFSIVCSIWLIASTSIGVSSLLNSKALAVCCSWVAISNAFSKVMGFSLILWQLHCLWHHQWMSQLIAFECGLQLCYHLDRHHHIRQLVSQHNFEHFHQVFVLSF